MIFGGPVGGGEMTVKLTDFGIARALEQTRITQVGSVVGTAAYLAPEQVRGEEATPATDVYALGVVLYQFLTGRLPYEGSTLAELAVRQQNERPLPPTTYNSEVPETLGAAVLRALEGDPTRRYASADELAGGLQRGLQGEDVTLPMRRAPRRPRCSAARPRPAASTRPAGPSSGRPSRRPGDRRRARPSPPCRRRAGRAGRASAGPSRASSRWVLALVALVLVAAAVAAAVILTTDKASGVHVTEVAGQHDRQGGRASSKTWSRTTPNRARGSVTRVRGLLRAGDVLDPPAQPPCATRASVQRAGTGEDRGAVGVELGRPRSRCGRGRPGACM